MAAISAQEAPGNMSLHRATESAVDNGSFSTTQDESIPRSNPIPIQEVPRVTPHKPTPLPDFVFPMKPDPSSPTPRSAPASFSRGGKRPKSAFELVGGLSGSEIDSNRRSPRAELPDFTFGSSPAQSPSLSPRNIPSRPGFHKRGGSEFIGGDGLTGNGGGLMSTSPTKAENALPLPNSSASGPPGGRRGHAHRRSAAISCHDLSMILKPDPSLAKGGVSAPTSPATGEYNPKPFPDSLSSTIQPTIDNSAPNSPEQITPARALNRNRVGFSDFVDIIPRPLSLVSSDSSSTVRQGHSVTGSMSSIVSGGTSSPQSKDRRGLVATTYKPDVRPRTADPVVTDHDVSRNLETPRRRNSIPLLMEVATASSPAPSTPRSLKKWSFFGGHQESGETSPKSRPTSSASAESKQKSEEPVQSASELANPDIVMQSVERTHSRRSSSLTRKPSKKPKKVRSWAGSILSRKSRQRKPKLSRRSPTPPLRHYTPNQEENDTYNFNEPEQEIPPPLSPMLEVETDIASWKPRRIQYQEEEHASPMIDLDAALGPFNTPTSFGEDWEASQRAGNGTRKRAMHSAAGLGGFSGPGMHYHRRAESAPEFENPRFGMTRLGGGSMGMEDVFEEENEDEDWEDTRTSDKESVSKCGEDEETGLGIDIKVVDSEGVETEKAMDFEDSSFQRGVKRKGSGLSDGDRRVVSSAKSEHSNRSVIDEPIMEEGSLVEIVDDSIPPRSDSGSKSSDSTATPPLRPAAKDLTPVDIQPFNPQPYPVQAPYPTPTSPPSTTQSSFPSSFPSPRSPYSYDTQRISTAQSSITEENYHSLLLGEPGPEIRMSVDDVPSLTSSNSTMTRESGIPAPSNHPQLREGHRSASMSSAAVSRKRSSIASLSRLISSSHGEKSKLSIETRPSTSEGPEKTEKVRRGKRLSRMMQFWKPKDT